MIIQGSNEPIVITFPETIDADKMELSLYNAKGELKHWSKADVTINDKTVTAPLTEDETMYFPEGFAKLEVKWIDSSDNIKHSSVTTIRIEHREDKTKMG